MNGETVKMRSLSEIYFQYFKERKDNIQDSLNSAIHLFIHSFVHANNTYSVPVMCLELLGKPYFISTKSVWMDNQTTKE